MAVPEEAVGVPRSAYRMPVTLENGVPGTLVFAVNLMSGNVPVYFVPDDPDVIPEAPYG